MSSGGAVDVTEDLDHQTVDDKATGGIGRAAFVAETDEH